MGAHEAVNANGAFEYGVDELTAVAEIVGASAFPGVGEAPFSELSGEGRDAALRSARRSLLAHGVLTIDDDGVLQIPPPHSELFRVAFAPALVMNAEHRRRDSIETRAYYALPEVAVEHSVAVGGVHRLEPFAARELLNRVREFVMLVDRPAGDGEQVELPAEELSRALAKGELPAGAGALGDALADLVAMSYVRCLHREGKAIVGGELRWIDTGEHGVWLIEPSQDDSDRVAVTRTAAANLFDELLSYLPGAERQPAAT
jgi:hypothetical protein